MLSSLYGNLPPPEAPKGGDVGGVGGGDLLSTLYGEEGGAGGGEDQGKMEEEGRGHAAKGDASGLVAPAWAANRVKMFLHPILRSRQLTASKQRGEAASTDNRPATSKSTALVVSDSTTGTDRQSAGIRGGDGGSTMQSLAISRPVARGPSPEADDRRVRRRTAEFDPRTLYDPLKPNNYEQVVKERALKRRQVEIERQQAEEVKRHREVREKSGPSSLSLNLSGEEAWRRRAMLSATDARPADTENWDQAANAAVEEAATVGAVGGSAGGAEGGLRGEGSTASKARGGRKQLAMRMMEQMGWKSGEGLGREKQGIVAPLVARKTDRKSGVIIQGGQAPRGSTQSIAGDAAKPAAAAVLAGLGRCTTPTRIVLLLNLVGRGEVDADLEEETAEEAARYGNLLGVKIREQDSTAPDDEAVRIFLEYESEDHAMKAFMTFNGRFFGGRVVKAAFYDEKSYSAGDLRRRPEG